MQFNNPIEYYHHQHGRLFVVGDLHGCYDELMQKLTRIQFDFQQDVLVCVGDLVDRGADSLKCLNLSHEPWFKSIIGNHEEMCLHSAIDPIMARLHAQHGGEWFYALSETDRNQVVELCQKMPIILEVEYLGQKYDFVHGDIEQNDWNAFKATIHTEKQREIALWGRSRIRNSVKKNFQNIQGIDTVFLGHTVVDLVTKRHNCYFIDTGAVFGMHLTVLQIHPDLPIEKQVTVV
ncbi:metallophosphoesterase [Acinetobacter piscicola]|uniref:metallophosphoesterase n=1 Tax=Acinetobacter piscicola TaxID=2006115 RepID=UPI00101EFFC9|nr:metallophosphoesterase [Acinetobacter piscicola]RYL29457.1 serine/threonine-protein phosphatase 2 [Acinetobacter piscicola]